MTANPLPCPTVIRLLLDCDHETGTLTWRKRPVWIFKEGGKSALHTSKIWNGRYAGKEALTALCKGYRKGSVRDTAIEAHRVVYCHKHGKWPRFQIDHIDGNPLNNSIENLRDVSPIENTRNRSMSHQNKSGHNGVHWCKKDKRWIAQISIKNKSKHLGQFRKIEDAIAARKVAEQDLGFHKNHGRPLNR